MTLLDPLPLRHEKVLERGMTNLKKYVDSTLDEWKYTGTKNNVRLYSRKPEIPQTPMIYRGDYHFAADPTMVEHVRPVDLSSAFVSQSIRKVVDARTGSLEVRVIRSRYSQISYAQTNPFWVVAARDFSQVSSREVSDDAVYYGTFSVIDDELNPPVAGFVRGHVECSGLKVSRDTSGDGGWMISMVVQADSGGSIPAMVAQRTFQTMPLVTQAYGDYYSQFGFPPTATLPESIEFLGENFDHEKALYTLHLGGGGTEDQVEVVCCQRMFPEGFDVEVQGDAVYDVDETIKKPHSVVVIRQLVGSVTILIVGKYKLSPHLKKSK